MVRYPNGGLKTGLKKAWYSLERASEAILLTNLTTPTLILAKLEKDSVLWVLLYD